MCPPGGSAIVKIKNYFSGAHAGALGPWDLCYKLLSGRTIYLKYWLPNMCPRGLRSLCEHITLMLNFNLLGQSPPGGIEGKVVMFKAVDPLYVIFATFW